MVVVVGVVGGQGEEGAAAVEWVLGVGRKGGAGDEAVCVRLVVDSLSAEEDGGGDGGDGGEGGEGADDGEDPFVVVDVVFREGGVRDGDRAEL